MNEIEKWYDEVYDEWTRLDRHRVEFDITKRYLDHYLKGDKLKIFDIGGARDDIQSIWRKKAIR